MAGATKHFPWGLRQCCRLACALWLLVGAGIPETAHGVELVMAIDHYPPYHIIPKDHGER